MSLSITSSITPASPVVTVASVKSVLHLNHTADDTDITNWIYAAGRLFERYTGISAQSTSYLYTLDRGHCDYHHSGFILSRYDLFSPLLWLNQYAGRAWGRRLDPDGGRLTIDFGFTAQSEQNLTPGLTARTLSPTRGKHDPRRLVRDARP